MRQFSVPILALGLVAAALAGCGSESAVMVPDPIEATVDRTASDPNAPTNEWVAGINEAGWDFHRTLDGNAVSSPVSLGAAFSLLRAGASEPTDITADTALVIVNTVYLDAKWRFPFDASFTGDGTFNLDDSGQVETEFMSASDLVGLRYVERSDSVVVELPYQDGDLSMWLIVPNEIGGLEEVEAGLDATTVMGFSEEAKSGAVSLRMPKWEYALPPTDLLATWLCPVGLCAKAPLKNIHERGELQFALHGAKIIVDEEGTEAGAATAIGETNASAPTVDLSLNVDRPFTYVITHEPTGAIVFVGRVIDPTQS